MTTWLTEADARELLVRAIDAAGSAEAFARQVGCSAALVSQALLGKRAIGRMLGGKLGLLAAPATVYQYLRRDETPGGQS
jgi:hypothetical protein